MYLPMLEERERERGGVNMMCIGNVIGVSIQSCAPVGKKEVHIKFSIEKNRALPEVK